MPPLRAAIRQVLTTAILTLTTFVLVSVSVLQLAVENLDWQLSSSDSIKAAVFLGEVESEYSSASWSDLLPSWGWSEGADRWESWDRIDAAVVQDCSDEEKREEQEQEQDRCDEEEEEAIRKATRAEAGEGHLGKWKAKGNDRREEA